MDVPRKYVSEFALSMVINKQILVRQNELSHPTVKDYFGNDRCHIYVICRRPRITIDPASYRLTKENASFDFLVQVQEKPIRVPYVGIRQEGSPAWELQTDFPHNRFILKDPVSGKKVGPIDTSMLLQRMGKEFHEFTDLEVMYVGQSFGDKGNRTAIDRLKSHSTLQGIYAETLARSPDKDVFLQLISFTQPFLITSFDGRDSASTSTTNAEDNEHISNVLNTGISEQQRINFTEAALIKYFQPEYNKTFRNSFPSPAHSTYSECYDIDLNMIAVEYLTEDIKARFWSKCQEPRYFHIAKFSLHNHLKVG